uniref:Uncharacterized protein n=1 Tax=viral metagenome TaxID=1070528 RepID=A0A6C0DZC6_9ZZZZ
MFDKQILFYSNFIQTLSQKSKLYEDLNHTLNKPPYIIKEVPTNIVNNVFFGKDALRNSITYKIDFFIHI